MTTTSTANASTTRPVAASESNLLPVPAAVRDAGLLIARVLLGVVLLVHGGQKLPTGVESNAKDYLDVHLVRGFFEDFVQKLILEDLPHSPLQLLHKQLEWEAKKALT